MTSNTRRRRAQRRLGAAPDRQSRRDAHDRQVAEAAARHIARALAPYGVLSRDALKRIAGAQRWHATSFERTLDTAIKLGLIDRRPLGFYRRHSDPPAGQARGSRRRR